MCLRPNFIVHIPFKNATERRTRHALITRARERERERREREPQLTAPTTLQNNTTMSEEEERQEQLRRRLETKEMELLEFERMLHTREREFRLQQELIECLETRNRELEEERREILGGSSTTLATLKGGNDEDRTKTATVVEEEEEENLSSPVYDAVASMFGRFTGLGGTTTTTTDTAGNAKVYDDDEDDFDDEVRGRGEQEGIVNIVVSEDENNKSGGPSSSRVSFVPGLVSVKDKRRLMFAVVDAEIDATQFVGLRRMSKEEKERMTTTTTSGSSNGGKQRNRHLKTLAQYLMHRSASQENLGTTTTTNSGSNSKNNNNANNSNDEGENLSSSSSMEMYEILWKEDGEMKRLAFEANAEGFIHVSKRVQKWSEEAKIAINAMPADTIPSSNDVVVVAAASSGVEKEEEGEKQTKRILEPMPKSQVSQQPELVGYAVKNAPIIDQMIQSCLISALPSRFRRSAWTLKYSSKRDGISLHSLYRAVRHSPATVLAVRDTNGYCFGAFSTEVWSTQNANRYFGTGESFVFAIEKDGDDTVTCFSWSGKNDYFQIAKSESLGVGGGSNYALWIDEDFTRGISGSYCETYNSECLASGEDFDVLNVEIYGID